MKPRHVPYSADELAWIKAFSDQPRRALHALFVQVWNRPEVTHDKIKALCTRRGWKAAESGQFKPGQKPHNTGKKGHHAPGSEKTWFKKGHGRSGNAITLYKPVGYERLTVDGYLERKINDGPIPKDRWRGVHRINYEAANGPVPAGHRLKCLDGNRSNVAVSNWLAIPYALAPRLDGRFGRGYDSAPASLKPLILATAQLEHAAREAEKGKRNG